MNNRNLPEIVKQALIHIGCDPSLIGDLDPHAPIELSFEDVPNIYIECDEDKVWFKSFLGVHSNEKIANCAEKLFSSVIEPFHWTEGNVVAMVMENDNLALKANVKDSVLVDQNHFAEAMADFYQKVSDTNKIINL